MSQVIKKHKTVVLFGGSGRLGREIMAENKGNWTIVAPRSRECDISDRDQVERYIERVNPALVLNAAAIVGAKECERNKEKAWKTNVEGAANIARACDAASTRLVFISSSSIFDGDKGLYAESDVPSPTYYYAVTKVAAEQAVLMARNSVVIRLDFFAPTQPHKYKQVLSDHYTSKCTVEQAASRIIEIAESDFTGIINVGNDRDSLYNILKQYYPGLIPIKTIDSALPNFPRDISLDLSLWKNKFGNNH